MYEVNRSEKVVDGEQIETWIAKMVSANMLEVEVGTNGYKGGDAGHGSRTYFKIKDLASTDINVGLEYDKRNGNGQGITIELGGDCELSTFLESLKFAVKVLEDQIANNP